MNTRLNLLFASLLCIFPLLVQAHSGHSVVEGWAHWFTPEHVLPALIAVVVLVCFFMRKKDRE